MITAGPAPRLLRRRPQILLLAVSFGCSIGVQQGLLLFEECRLGLLELLSVGQNCTSCGTRLLFVHFSAPTQLLLPACARSFGPLVDASVVPKQVAEVARSCSQHFGCVIAAPHHCLLPQLPAGHDGARPHLMLGQDGVQCCIA